MNYLRVCLLLFIIASIGLHAGIKKVEKNGPIQKELELSIEHKESAQDKNKLTLVAKFKEGSLREVILIVGGKAKKVVMATKDGVMLATFEIEKTDLEKAKLKLSPSGTSPLNCEFAYLLHLVEHVGG